MEGRQGGGGMKGRGGGAGGVGVLCSVRQISFSVSHCFFQLKKMQLSKHYGNIAEGRIKKIYVEKEMLFMQFFHLLLFSSASAPLSLTCLCIL